MPTIRMPDGANVQFPDDMSHDQIRDMIKKKFPNTDFSAADPGFWAAAGRTARGVATGAENVVDTIGMHLPGFLQGANKPEEVQKALRERAPPKDEWESLGVGGGEIATSAALTPGLGIAAPVVRGLRYARGLRGPQLGQFVSPKGWKSALERIAGSGTEGAARGGIAGAMITGDDATENAEIGAGVGGGIRGLGAIGQSSVMALPPKIKNTASALAAVAAASKLGMPWWAALMHPGGWHTNSMFQQLYDANLADLAAKYFRGVTRTNPAVLGASGVKLKDTAAEGQ